jgi:hypothetical protein
MLLAACPAGAAPPTDSLPDPRLESWFSGLRQPKTALPCCSISDCRMVNYRADKDQYMAEIEDHWYHVPGAVVLPPGTGNPTGRAVACYTFGSFGFSTMPGMPKPEPQDAIEILCFIPPRPTS